MKLTSVCVAVALAVGCNSPAASLNASELLVDVTIQQVAQECSYLATMYPQKQVTCNGVVTVIGQSATNCNAAGGDVPLTCTATVGDFEDCAAASYDDPCGSDGDTISKACDKLDGCGSDL